MKIELDIKDLTETINALNNAINTYNDLKASIVFDMDVPTKYQKLISTNADCNTHQVQVIKGKEFRTPVRVV